MKQAVKVLSVLCGVLFFAATYATAEPANVVFVLDASGSMWGQIKGKAKIVIAKEVLNGLIDGLPQDMQVGLYAYGHRSKGDCKDIEQLIAVGPLDRKAMKAKIAGLNAKGMTPITESVRQAAEALRYKETKATVILVSDGLETCDADPCQLAAELAMSGVDFTVHVIGFDITEEEQARLRCLADKTGGLFLAAGDAASLKSALTETVAKAEEAPKPVVEDPGKATLQAPASVTAGSEFQIQWQGPDSRNDFIAISPKDQKETAYQNYVYTEKGNPALLTAPGKAGAYELRYVHAKSGKVIGRADVQVTPIEAKLTAPASVQVAADFDVAWEGPNYKGDYVTISRPKDLDSAYVTYTYTNRGNPAVLTAPSDPGNYEVRYVMANDNTVLARVAIVIEKAEAQVEAPASANVASEFEVKWQGPDAKGDYISIALPADDGGKYKAYTYTKSGNPLKLKAPSDPGQYEVRYILGQGNKILAKIPISIQAVTASVEAPATAPAGSTLEVSWQGPSEDGDYISIATQGSAPASYKHYTYTNAGSPLKLQAPSDPGQYEVRYILGQGNKLLAKASITLTAVSATVTAPAEVAAKSKLEASWTGPGYDGDYVTIVEANAKDDQYKSYFYANTGPSGELTAPDKPGAYEVRYVMGQGHKVIGRSKITVK